MSRNLSPICPALCHFSTYRRRPMQGGRGSRPSSTNGKTRSLLSCMRCHRCHGFATRHSRYRLGHHIGKGRPVGSCTRPPIRVRGACELRPRCQGRDRERSGRAPGEAAPWSRRSRRTLAASRAAPFSEEVSLTVLPVPPPPAVLSSTASQPAGAQAKPLDFAQGAFLPAGTDLSTLGLLWGRSTLCPSLFCILT